MIDMLMPQNSSFPNLHAKNSILVFKSMEIALANLVAEKEKGASMQQKARCVATSLTLGAKLYKSML